jgi:hypothetical protein
MTLEEIKTAIDSGKRVHWASTNYNVIRDDVGQYLIVCVSNSYCIGLTWKDGKTLNGKESEFFTEVEI